MDPQVEPKFFLCRGGSMSWSNPWNHPKKVQTLPLDLPPIFWSPTLQVHPVPKGQTRLVPAPGSHLIFR